MALLSDGTVFVWGTNIYLGNNTAVVANQNRAAQMTLPAGITPKLIGSGTNGSNDRSFYVLATDGNLYALGRNNVKQLGDWTTTDRLAWIQPRYTSAAGPVMNNIIWFSPQEHDTQFNACSVINNAKNLYSFGQNSFSMISTTTDPLDPFIPSGLTTADLIQAVEHGGHTTMTVKQCQVNFGYVGHHINGSIGNGSTTNGNEVAYTFATAPIVVCGTGTPDIAVSILPNGSGSNYCVGSSATLSPFPAGGTLSLVSGPATLVGNNLTFTGLGTVVVQYVIADPCGGPAISTTKSLTTENCPADISIVKTVSNATPNVGTNVTFTLTVTNNATYATTGVFVTDVLPTGYTVVGSPTVSAGTWSAPTWTIGNLASGASQTLTITATVNPSGNYSNTATISGDAPDPTPANNSSTSTPVPVPQANVGILKTVNNATPNVGSNVIFTLTANNAGPSTATSVSVTDVLPSGYTYFSNTAPSAGTFNSGTGIWSVGTLTNGSTATLTIIATVNASGIYANTASIAAAETDPTPTNDSSTSTPVSVPQANVGILKTVNNATPNVGSNVIFTLTANNAGPSTATSVSVTDVLPSGYTYLSNTVPSAGTFNSGTGIWSVGTLTNGSIATLTITATVNAAGIYANTASINATEGDPTSSNNSSTSTPAVNYPPNAVTDNYTVNEDTVLTLLPLTADSDPNGTTPTILSINGTLLTPGIAQVIIVPNGIVNISAAGIITFTPNLNFNGSLNFPYVITDGSLTATASQIITVTAVNDAPIAVTDTYTVNEDTPLTLLPLTADSDPDGTTPTILSINGTVLTPGIAQIILVPNGTINITAVGIITFTPNLNFTGSLNFPYVITDGSLTASALQIITVTPVNDPPVAIDDLITINEDTPVIITPLANDTDVDGNPLTIVSINGVLLTPGVPQTIVVPNGVVTISITGVITFTPNPNYNGPVSFPYVISDGNGGTATANVLITVVSVNDVPVLNPNSNTTPEDVTLTVIDGATGINGDVLVVTQFNVAGLTVVVTPSTPGVLTIPGVGTLTMNSNGSYTFVPALNYNGTVPVITYTASDGNGGFATSTLTITVTPVNDPPVAVNDLITVNEDTPVIITPLANDTDVDGNPITIVSINGVLLTPGVAQTIVVPNGVITISASGVITFTPNPNYSGPISFPYVISDGNGGTATANVLITVVSVIDELTFYNFVSPDDDGNNDVFFIDGLQDYPNNTVEIYNRWGVLVYEVDGYDNTSKVFKGISDGRVTINRGDQLPDGTYYYVIRYVTPKGEAKEKAGYLYITRK